MLKKLIAIILIITISSLIMIGCTNNLTSKKGAITVMPGNPEDKEPVNIEVTEEINEINDMEKNLEDDELDSDLDNIDESLSEW